MTATAIMDVVSDDEGQEPAEQLFTIDDLDALENNGDARRFEIIDGSLRVSPPPYYQHSLVEGRLLRTLGAQLPRDVDVLPGAGIHHVTETTRWLVPDSVMVRSEVAARGPKFLGPDDVLLVVEVVSPSSVTHDRTTKRALYAGMGIEHYWIIEQTTELRLTALRLKGPEFEEVAVFGRGDTVELTEPFPVRFRLAELVS
jgi:Uma2 family endonuclease